MSIHLINSNSVFFQVPKTGGTWAYHAIENSGIQFELYHEHGAHNNYITEDLTNKKSFAFVRRPFEFYRSYWCYKMEHGWDKNWYLDDYCRSDDFEQFLENIIKKKYPYCTQVYRNYIGEPAVINYVGRQENLANDLVRILRSVGEDFDEEKLRNTPRINSASLKPKYNKYLKTAIELLDKEVINKFYYGIKYY